MIIYGIIAGVALLVLGWAFYYFIWWLGHRRYFR